MMGRCAVRHKAGGEPEFYLPRGGADDADFKLLSAEEERALANAIARGDEQARDRMVKANVGLVAKIARCYLGHGLGMDDLFGEGILGLIRATVEYDPNYNVRFSTYAAHWIKQSIRFALTNTNSMIRLPSHINGLMGKWHKVEQQMRREGAGSPTAKEVADRLGLTEAQREMIDRGFRARRLRQEGGDGDDAWNPDDAPDDRHQEPDCRLANSDELRKLRNRLEQLDDRERAIVSMRYGLGGGPTLTLKQVGECLGITREWVRKIEGRAMAKLGGALASSGKSKAKAATRPDARRPSLAEPIDRPRRKPRVAPRETVSCMAIA